MTVTTGPYKDAALTQCMQDDHANIRQAKLVYSGRLLSWDHAWDFAREKSGDLLTVEEAKAWLETNPQTSRFKKMEWVAVYML